MKRAAILRWMPVVAGLLLTAGLWLVGFRPLHLRAQRDAARVRTLAAELEQKIVALREIPWKKNEMDSLTARLGDFRAGLFRTDQVGELMRAFEDRAADAGISFWKLDPALPTLLKLESERDSIALLNLALLPLQFQCKGEFDRVGRFLETEASRPGFCQWKRLTVTPSDRKGEVRADGDILIFLLPAENFDGEAS
jgi:hypothetical protein